MTSEFDVSHLPAEEAAAHLLVTPSALADLSLADAARVVAYMKPKRFKAGTIVIQEGEARYNDYMLLLLSGDIAVENELPGAGDSMVVTIIGPGSLLGEMGVIDGSPRSATCTANTDITVGILTRTALMRLLRDEPGVGARLLLAITKRMSDRLRETTRKLRTFAQMNRVLQQELNVVMNNRIRAERSSDKAEPKA
ncbi:cyclic nucleotide-binding domain-containing protein [Hydrogenophaga sp. R2]|uniref:cyclic nucleotide-binding domain-containing protein n=1 Tax=Hydrogenophaga sp. R2 TaxID=3132827 RepID=UPI003CFAB838